MLAVRCWNATRFDGSSWRLESRRPAFGAEHDFRGAGEERLRSVARSRDRTGTSSSTTDAWAPSPSRTSVRVNSARSASPSTQRTTIGCSSWTPAGTSISRPCVQAARVSWANLSSRGQRSGRVSRSRTASRSAWRRRTDDAGAPRGIGQLDRDVAALDELGQAIGALGQLDRAACRRRSVDRERGVGRAARGRRSMYGV